MTPELVIRPLQWSALPPLEDAPPLDASDLACMRELRDVLARHGKLQRFAVHLAHAHFELQADEVLIERPDPDGRTQHVTVGKLTDEPLARPTTWLFEDGPALHFTPLTHCVCVSNDAQTACIRHGFSPIPTMKDAVNDAIRERVIAEDKAKHEGSGGGPVAGHDRGRSRRDDEGR